MKILANDGISQAGIDALTQSGFSVDTTRVAQDQLEQYIINHQIEVLLVRSATQVRQDLIDATNLKIIGRGGVGMDNIDVDYARKKGIHVINTPAASSNSVAELVFAHMLSMARFLQDANRNMPLEGESKFKELKKNYAKATELKGKTLGILGLGRIGREVARIGIGMGMRVIGTDHTDTDGIRTIHLELFNGDTIPYKIEVLSQEDVLQQADFITLHVPAQKDYVIGKNELDMMKDGAMLVNAARGGVIDEIALLDAIEKGKLHAAALDVFENEPKPEVQLLMHPKLSLSPHVGGSTIEAQERIGLELAQQIADIYNNVNV